jgi:hypothetical protein
MLIVYLFYASASCVLINNSTLLIFLQTVRSLRADYRTMQVSRDELHVQLSDFKEQLEYKQLVAQTVDVALGALPTSSPSLLSALRHHCNLILALPSLTSLSDTPRLAFHVALLSPAPYLLHLPSSLACCRHTHCSPHLLPCYY